MFIILSIEVYLYFKYKNALYYTFYNKLLCGKEQCDPVIKDDLKLNIPINIKEYDPNLARYCGDLINRVYYKKDSKNLKKIKEIKNNEDSDIPFVVIWQDNNNNLFVIFRGTDNIQEFVQDLNTNQTKRTSQQVQYSLPNHLKFYKSNKNYKNYTTFSQNILIHDGFNNIYNEIKDELLKTIKSIKLNNVIISGHSLGAAVSVLFALDISTNNKVVYNFGCPRIGNEDFSDLVDKNISVFRLFNDSDIVTSVPAVIMPNYSKTDEPYFYKHCGILKNFDINWKSFENNHNINCYIYAIDNNLIL